MEEARHKMTCIGKSIETVDWGFPRTGAVRRKGERMGTVSLWSDEKCPKMYYDGCTTL